MKTFLSMILAVLVIVVLVACSDGDQGDKSAAKKADEQEAAQTAELPPADDAQATVDQNLALCRAATKKLGGALKSALQTAMGEGGPVAALTVCHDEAEVIARQICQEEGLIVGRTSRKFRNRGNTPDLWELAGLAAFQARIAAGEKPKDLEMWDTVSGADGQQTFRYLKAIPTAPLCLKCHGKELAPSLAEKLGELYPQDLATGFEVGDMRGAFTVKIELPRS